MSVCGGGGGRGEEARGQRAWSGECNGECRGGRKLDRRQEVTGEGGAREGEEGGCCRGGYRGRPGESISLKSGYRAG